MQIEIHFANAPIVVPRLRLPSREIGACVEFQGIVRGTEAGKPLEGLVYEAYEPMAERELRTIIDQVAAQHSCEQVVFIHRVGWVPVGEASLFIRVLAKHRGEALRFCNDLIDRMKKDVPIWKCNS